MNATTDPARDSVTHPVTDPTAYYTAQYNTRADAAYAEATLARWAVQGQTARRTQACSLDAPCGESARERVDFFPAKQSGAPLLVFIHGGWWRFLSKSEFSWVAQSFVAAGYNVALTDYDLCPNVKLQNIVEQTLRAVAYVYMQADRWEFDATRMHVAGHSAGGHLAAMMCAADWSAYDKSLPKAVFKSATLISGIFDLHPLVHIRAAQADLQLSAADLIKLSPLSYAPSPVPTMAFAGGLESDDFKRQNAVLGKAWGQSVQISQVAQRNHFSVVDAWADAAHPLHQAVLAHMKAAESFAS
jgi:arylformamidase